MELMTVKEEELDTSEIDESEITLKEEELNISDVDDLEMFSDIPSLTPNNIEVRTLTEHMRSHSQERPFECTICGTFYKRNRDLNKHLKTCRHTDKQLMGHICDLCGKGFIIRSKLTKHMVSHSQERNFECTICGTFYKRKNALNVHLKDRHADNFQMEFGHICELCTKGFKSKSKLAQHMVCHSQERNFKCAICGTTFKRERDLSFHLKSRHADTF